MTDSPEKLQYQQSMRDEALKIIENVAFKEAMTSLKKSVFTEWAKCEVNNEKRQKELLSLYKNAEKFEQILSGMIEHGNNADALLDRLTNRDENVVSKLNRFIRGA